MKISVVTISYNQAKYVGQCINSVLDQDYSNIEYIVVDPGSTDGSRELITSYGSRIKKIFEKDFGPADGLNIGFRYATGDIFCYLNSDDIFLPEAFHAVANAFLSDAKCDVICGHGHIIDGQSKYLRRVFSDRFSLKGAAYGASLAIQPSTFFRRTIFERIGGFNVYNKSNWDGELLIDMALAGADIKTINRFLSCYRVHNTSITGSGRLSKLHAAHSLKMFSKIMDRPFLENDNISALYYRLMKHIKNPRATYERILYGPIFGTHN